MSDFETKQTAAAIEKRNVLYSLFDKMYAEGRISKHLLFQCLGIFIRNSGLAKILFVNELYEEILDRPGIIMEFGCHMGQNLVLFESLRAIYEPFNNQRRIIGFDSFQGYQSVDTKTDGSAEEILGGGYALPADYKADLEAILKYHEENSVLPHKPRCEVVDGDVTQTAKAYVEAHPGEILALGYFDLATYKPTMACLEAVRERLIPGSVLLMDELNFREYPGASTAFLEFTARHGIKYTVRTSRYMRDRSIVTVVDNPR